MVLKGFEKHRSSWWSLASFSVCACTSSNGVLYRVDTRCIMSVFRGCIVPTLVFMSHHDVVVLADMVKGMFEVWGSSEPSTHRHIAGGYTQSQPRKQASFTLHGFISLCLAPTKSNPFQMTTIEAAFVPGDNNHENFQHTAASDNFLRSQG